MILLMILLICGIKGGAGRHIQALIPTLVLQMIHEWVGARNGQRRRAGNIAMKRTSFYTVCDDSSDDFANLRHKRRSRKAYSGSDSDVSASDDSRVGRGKKGLRRRAGNIAMNRTSFYTVCDDSSDDFANLRHKRRSRKAYSGSDSDVSALDDSQVGRGKKRSEKKICDYSSDDFANLRHKIRSRKAYSGSDSDASASDDSRGKCACGHQEELYYCCSFKLSVIIEAKKDASFPTILISFLVIAVCDDSSDYFANLWFKRRSRKAYSGSDSDVNASDDSRLGRGKKRSEKKSRKHRHEED
ncbi:uncharacterized protein LOC110012930 [Sesamum indicum]|uniref:Uncharacterized protein LOC110012930 n=1 Tax=Sesamum indicum TaxID=4182 RepID=A0A8M8VB56_SESIN|nr:uncharacterized protein LOC110012930 [Sesamum indicum]